MSGCYLDTSALAKWYVNEPGSDAFEAFVRGRADAIVSRLTATELRCLLARRRRGGDFDAAFERDAYTCFERDMTAGHLSLHPFTDAVFVDAGRMIGDLDGIALRTLDALHLAIALDATATSLATADRIMARAGEALGLDIEFFGAGDR